MNIYIYIIQYLIYMFPQPSEPNNKTMTACWWYQDVPSHLISIALVSNQSGFPIPNDHYRLISVFHHSLSKTERQVSKQREGSNSAFSEQDLFHTIWTAVTSFQTDMAGGITSAALLLSIDECKMEANKISVSSVNGNAYLGLNLLPLPICLWKHVSRDAIAAAKQLWKLKIGKNMVLVANMVLFYE